MKKPKNEQIIHLLIDSVFYDLEHIFILCEKTGFRLIVINLRKEMEINAAYPTVNDAKAAFHRDYDSAMICVNLKYDYGDRWRIYPPDKKWLKALLSTPMKKTPAAHPLSYGPPVIVGAPSITLLRQSHISPC